MVNWDELKEGDIATSMDYGPLERSEFVKYANAGGDTNPIHVDEFAGLVNNGVIAHGLYSHAMLGKMLVDWAGVGNVRAYNGRMVGMARPGDIIHFEAIVTKKYEEDGEKLIDLDIKSITKTYFLRGKGKCDPNMSDEDVLKKLADTPVKVTIVLSAAGEKKHELQFEPKGLEIRRKDIMADEPLIRNWLRDKDVISAEFIGKRKGGDFKFGILRNQESIVGTATAVIK